VNGKPETRSRFDAGAVLLLAVLLIAVLLAPVNTRAESAQVVSLGGSAIWVAIWGLITDRWVLPRGLRAAAVILASVGLHYAGLRIDAVKLPFSTTFVTLGLWSLPVAAFWMCLCSALFARAGTIPGVAYGVGAAACFALTLVCLRQPQTMATPTVFLAVPVGLVCLLWFLAKLAAPQPTGTAGAYLLGFLIGAASIMGMLKNTAFLAAVLPLLLVSVPLFGAAYSYLAEIRRGRRRLVLTQHHEHLHGLLLRRGHSPRQVALLLTAVAVWFGALAVLLVALIEVSFVLKTLVLLAWLALGGGAAYLALRVLPRDGVAVPESVRLLGVRLTPLAMEEALERARQFIADGSPHMIVTSDALGLIAAQDDEDLRRIMDEADMVTPDGQGVVLAARLLDLPIRERVSGVDMVRRLCEVAAAEGRSVFLLGAAQGVAEEAAGKLREAVPGLQVAGTHHGYFSPEEEVGIIEQIRAARPAVLFVAFGIPKQEKWIRAHLTELGVPVCIGVGGSLDVISGRLKRAPLWVRRCGLEWLFRVLQEPRRLPRIRALPRIVWLAFRALLRGDDAAQEPSGRPPG
jgi:N-acetylglucosaminyldiphosphoundecaprenol N-acetyl-beta-D-mannosaminyltransferase